MTRLAHPEGPVASLGQTKDDESFFVRRMKDARVLVVGSGGGREVLLALRNGASEIVGVEINPDINQIVTEDMAAFTGHLADHPAVNLVTDEARSFIRRSAERFDLIHCPHTISNAAMSSGSLSLAENHLMTLEAFDDYLNHLSPRGVLLITRPEPHLPRLFATARAAFERQGLPDVERSVVAWRARSKRQSFYAAFAMRSRPFAPEELDALAQVLKARKLEPLYLPGHTERPPYRAVLTADDPASVPVPFATILVPATDDKPFFNQRVPFSDIGFDDLLSVFNPGQGGRWALEDRPVAECSLLILLLQTVVVALVFILVPLWIFRRRSLAGSGRLRSLAAFGCLGLAYIVVEVGLIQRLNLYLGQPVVVFATVLGTLLVCSGLGSAFARRFKGDRAPGLAAATAGAVALVTALLAPLMVDASLAWPLWARVSMVVVLLVPAGFVMGMPFPLLVRRLEQAYPERIPWAWGVNGFASVVGSIGAVLLGMTLGFTAVLLTGVGCYALAALASLGGGSLVDGEGAK